MKLATLLYIKDNDKYLMIHRVKRDNDMFKDIWNGIGGKINDNESPEECVIREAKEESGLEIKDPILKGIITFPNNRDSGETWYVFVFITENFKGKVIENEEGVLNWIPIKETTKLNIQNADRHFLKWIQEDKLFSAKFYYNGNRLKDFQVYFY